LDPNETSRPNANVIRVDSDDDQLKFTTGNSGTTEVDVVTESQTQTLTNKTLTSPTITGATLTTASLTSPKFVTSVVFDESTADLTVTASDQAAAGTVNFPDLNGVNAGVVVASTTLLDVTDGHDNAVGTSTGTIELPSGAIVLDVQVAAKVLWNSGTSDTLNVGDDDAAGGWFTNLDMQDGGDVLVGEICRAAATGDATNGPGQWAGANGAYLVEATGVMGQAVANYAGNFLSAASEVIYSLTTVGTKPTTGTTFGTVLWAVPTQTAATYVQT